MLFQQMLFKRTASTIASSVRITDFIPSVTDDTATKSTVTMADPITSTALSLDSPAPKTSQKRTQKSGGKCIFCTQLT